MTPAYNNRVLIIDNDLELCLLFRDVLGRARITPCPATDHSLSAPAGLPSPEPSPTPVALAVDYATQGQDGFDMVRDAVEEGRPYTLALIDIRMPPGWDGMETAARIRRIDPNIEIVMITAHSDRSRAEIVDAVGSPDKLLFLRKPFGNDELTQLAISLSAKWNLGQKVQEQHAYLDGVLRANPAAIFTTDPGCTVHSWNLSAEAITGYSAAEVLGRPCPLPALSGTHPCQGICHDPAQGTREPLEVNLIDKGGSSKCVLISIAPIAKMAGQNHHVVVMVDITHHKKVEAQLVQSQKMEAIGSLAGGIAHDLNNLLSPIIGFAQMTQLKINDLAPELKTDPTFNEQLALVEECGSRAGHLLRQILAFSRPKVFEPVSLNLNKVIKDFTKMLRRLIREDIELCLSLAPDLKLVLADRAQMEQIIMNLVVNARDAVPPGGRITIATRNQPVIGSPLASEQGSVCLSVSDTGCGMDEETASHVFDPFFTTKEKGVGTGLGLSTVLSIVNSHGGQIQLDTAPGQGAAFLITFPAEDDLTAEHPAPSEEKPSPKGTESILLVEDSPEPLKLTAAMLRSFGYRVILAANGQEAWDLFAHDPGQIDLLFTDLIMPLMNGRELAKAAREIKPGLPVLFMTGHTFDLKIDEMLAEQGTGLIRKPFNLAAMGALVRNLLDEGKKRKR